MFILFIFVTFLQIDRGTDPMDLIDLQNSGTHGQTPRNSNASTSTPQASAERSGGPLRLNISRSGRNF